MRARIPKEELPNKVKVMTKRAALILAGGKSYRFQIKSEQWQDKALTELFGKPLLIHAIENVRRVVDEVVICIDDEARKTKYAQIMKKHNLGDVSFVVDEKISNVGGPSVAILTGLKSTRADLCVTLPCDMPLLKPQIIEYLFDAAGDAQVTVPMWPNGRLETLVTVLERGIATEIIQTLCSLRRSRFDDIIRGASKVLFISTVGEMRALDPELKSFVNINRHEDLSKLQTRPTYGSITENFEVNLGALIVLELRRLQEVSAFCYETKFAEATMVFSSCATSLEKEKSFFWAGISRENEGKTLLARYQLKKESEITAELDFRGKNAFLAAINNYKLEADAHLERRCRFLAKRALADKAWCESWVIDKIGNRDRDPLKY
jgi:molybdopterin-guanine dinucleotide biosynthesis protein A